MSSLSWLALERKLDRGRTAPPARADERRREVPSVNLGRILLPQYGQDPGPGCPAAAADHVSVAPIRWQASAVQRPIVDH